ncbi:MAG: hypothetical protein RJA13_778 [Bacteroidota bacterium]
MNSYLSIVATTRNDNHGEDLLKRTTAFVNGIYHQSKRHNISIELIIVEWNPPEDKESLFALLPHPMKDIPVTLRIIQVPAEIHNRFRTSDVIPLYQMIAKNVGIRRAKSPFVLATNIDLLFSDELMSFLASKTLIEGMFYRANRCDVPKEVLDIAEVADQLNYCKRKIIRRLGKRKGLEGAAFPAFLSKSTFFMRLYYYPLMWLWYLTQPGKYPHFKIDFDACGDFTLMSKTDWESIQGYAELDMYSIHIDSMALWAAVAVGMEQKVLPPKSCTYHIDHADGWESSNVAKTIKFLESKPCLDYSIVKKGGIELIELKKHWNLNSVDWGFYKENLTEKLI